MPEGDWTDLGIFVALGINIAITAGIFIVFSFQRRLEFNRLTYEPRSVRAVEIRPAMEGVDPYNDPLPKSFFGWLPALLAVDDLTILRKCGLDAVMYIKLERYALRLVTVVSLLCTCILVPVNLQGTENLARELKDPENFVYLRGFNEWLVSNISNGSNLLWVHVTVFMLVCSFCYWLILQLCEDFYRTRKYFRRMQGENLQVYASETTVLIRGLPLSLRDGEELKKRIEKMVPNEVKHVWIQFDCSAITKLREKEMSLMVQLDAARGELFRTKKRPMKKIPMIIGQPVDLLSKLERDLSLTRDAIQRERERDLKTTGSAFVMFKSIDTAKRMAQNFYFHSSIEKTVVGGERERERAQKRGVKDWVKPKQGIDPVIEYEYEHSPTYWEVDLAPMPNDVIFSNLKKTNEMRSVMGIIIAIVTIFLVLFWAIPVGILGSLQNLAKLPIVGAFFRKIIEKLPVVIFGLISTYLPVVVVIVFNALLPKILEKFALIAGSVNESQVRSVILEKFFFFILFSVIVIPSVIVGGLGRVTEIINEISQDALGQSLSLLVSMTTPQTTLYIGYMMQVGLIGSSLSIMNIAHLILSKIRLKMAVTKHMKRQVLKPIEFNYHLFYPILLLVLAMGLLFCISMPITPVFTVLFFMVKSVSDKYIICYCAQSSRQSDGSMTRSALKILTSIVAVLQIASIGMFAGMKAYAQAILAGCFSVLSFFVFRYVTARVEAIFRHDLFVPDGQAKREQAAEVKELEKQMEEEAEKGSSAPATLPPLVLSRPTSSSSPASGTGAAPEGTGADAGAAASIAGPGARSDASIGGGTGALSSSSDRPHVPLQEEGQKPKENPSASDDEHESSDEEELDEAQKAALELLSAPVADIGKETRVTEEKLRNAYLNPALIDPDPLPPPIDAPDLSKLSAAIKSETDKGRRKNKPKNDENV